MAVKCAACGRSVVPRRDGYQQMGDGRRYHSHCFDDHPGAEDARQELATVSEPARERAPQEATHGALRVRCSCGAETTLRWENPPGRYRAEEAAWIYDTHGELEALWNCGQPGHVQHGVRGFAEWQAAQIAKTREENNGDQP